MWYSFTNFTLLRTLLCREKVWTACQTGARPVSSTWVVKLAA